MDVAVQVAADKDGWKQQRRVGEQCNGGMRMRWFSAGGPGVKDSVVRVTVL